MSIPPPLALEDLDRDELLELMRDRVLVSFRQSDLWHARWKVRSWLAEKANARRWSADEAYMAVLAPVDPSKMSARAWAARQKEREAKRRLMETAKRAARRAEANAERAWDALEASYARPAKQPETA